MAALLGIGARTAAGTRRKQNFGLHAARSSLHPINVLPMRSSEDQRAGRFINLCLQQRPATSTITYHVKQLKPG
jgi:hypothetical protein